jgi:hypothetical protein
MDGNTWEEYCHHLLRIRYTDYQKVPAKYGGDLGIEGFTFSGLVFQCYCCDDDPSGRDLYEKQREKITADIGKFVRNAVSISKLGTGSVREWQFLTPYYDSRELIGHCRSKELEVQGKSLPQVHDNFRIMLKVEDDFGPERQVYVGAGVLRVQPTGDDLQGDELEKLLLSDNEIVSNIRKKLERLTLHQDQQARLTEELVGGYVIGQDELQHLNEKYPVTYQSVMCLKSAMEAQLAILALAQVANHGAGLYQILKMYEDKLYTDFSGVLSHALITRLSTEAISDWMGRCPLDFHGTEVKN